MKVVTTNQVLTPMIFHSEYKESFKEILFTQHDYYIDKARSFVGVDFSDYRVDKLDFLRHPYMDLQLNSSKFYSYGLLINLLRTKLIPLDFDNVKSEKELIELAKYYIQKINIVNRIDIFQSSQNNYHMYIGLKDFYSARSFIAGNMNICSGYKKIGLNMSELVIRVSQKFFKELETINIKFIVGIQKENNKIEISYNHIYPLTNIKVPEIKEEPKKIIPKVRLR